MNWILIFSLFFTISAASIASADKLKCPSLHNGLDYFDDYEAEVIPTAIIGPTNDWKYLRAAAKEWGISEEMVADILAAGINLNCDGVTNNNGLTVNSWLLSGNSTKITAPAHEFYDEQLRPRGPFGNCSGQSLADIVDSIDNSNSVPQSYLNPNSIRVGTTDPYNDNGDPQNDRATASLANPIPGTKSLSIPIPFPQLSEGDEIFAVSRRPKSVRKDENDKEPMIFKTTLKKLIPKWNGLPGGFLSDVDDIPGDSGMLYLVRDKAHAGRLVPIGIGKGAFERTDASGNIVNGAPYKAFENAALGLSLDENFYKFESN